MKRKIMLNGQFNGAMQTGKVKCIWPDIPEEYWKQAVMKVPVY